MTTKQQAFSLYFQSDLTQAQIAQILSIDRKTLYTWIREGDWKRARKVARQAPSLLVEQYYTQLVNINDHIAAREEAPFPTKDEAAVIHRLTMTISRVRTGPGPAEIMEIFTDFTHHILANQDLEQAQNVMRLLNNYVSDLTKKNSSGFSKRPSFHLATGEDDDAPSDHPATPYDFEQHKPGSHFPAPPAAHPALLPKGGDQGPCTPAGHHTVSSFPVHPISPPELNLNRAQMGNPVAESPTGPDHTSDIKPLENNDLELSEDNTEPLLKNEKNGEENRAHQAANTPQAPSTGDKEGDPTTDGQTDSLPQPPSQNDTPVPFSKYRRERKPAGFKRYSYSRTVYVRRPPPGYFP